MARIERNGARDRLPLGLRRAVRLILLLSGASFLGGFGWFVHLTAQRPAPLPAHVDGIVALTGGHGRVETALRLLAGNRADRLLVSGIGGGTELMTLGHMAGIDPMPLAARITLGRYAASTRGNGVEAAAWAARNNIASLIVVTAGYHMPRALAELRSALPNVTLYPLPVQRADGSDRGPGWKLEAEEYAKFLFTVSGISAWLPRREATAEAPTLSGPAG